MKLFRCISIFTVLCFTSCSIEEAIIEDLTPEIFGNWTPDFTNQTESFSQTRSGSKGTTESRNITVSVGEEIVTDNERIVNTDLNEDGDRVDYIQYSIFTYTASENLGSFEITSDWVVSEDQTENFANRNFGYHAAVFSSPSFIDSSETGAIIYLISLGDNIEDFKIGERFEDNENDCFEMKTIEETYSSVPYQSIQDLSGTREFFSDDLVPNYYNIKYKMLDIDFGEWTGNNEYDGILVDYIVEWASKDPIEYSEEIYRVSDRNEIVGNGNGQHSYNNSPIGQRSANLGNILNLDFYNFSLCE